MIWPLVEFFRTYDAGCCKDQSAMPWGWRILILNRRYEIRFGPWERRIGCESCEEFIRGLAPECDES